MGRWRATGTFVLLVVFGINISSAGAAQAAPTEVAIGAAMTQRASFGLPSSRAVVADLLTSGRDVGTGIWGIPMTADEEQALDLSGRMEFFLEVDETVLPFVRTLPSFGGAYIDQPSGGGLVVLLTDPDQAIEQQIAARAPAVSRGVAIRYVEHAYGELVTAMHRVRDVLADLVPDATVYGVALEEDANRLRVEVDFADLQAVEASLVKADRILGVPVRAVVGLPEEEQDCTSRDNCDNPMKAGIKIRRGSISSGTICTMGFHVRNGTDERFLSAGHCGHGAVYSWYHQGYGLIGAELASLYYHGGKDAHLVQMPDSQASDDIYDDSLNITGASNPVTGMVICGSFAYGMQGGGDTQCGTVDAGVTNWTGTECGCLIWGADAASLFGQAGDSGAPLYVNGPNEYATGYGIWNTGSGKFARLLDVLTALGSTIVV